MTTPDVLAVAAPTGGVALLTDPAYNAVRRVALARVQDIADAHARFAEGDPDGLHDMRVAMRRLRTWIRAFKPWLADSLQRKTRRRLRTLARATNEARDAEVASAWVEAQQEIPPRALAGIRAACSELAHERDAALRAVRAELMDDVPPLLHRLTAQLGISDAARTPPESQAPMADAAWEVIETHVARLIRALAKVSSPADLDAAHRARIAAKQLRYVLEPLHETTVVRERLAPLIDLQDLLGAARDAHQMARRYVRDVGKMAARDARRAALAAIGVRRGARTPSGQRVRTGLIELARRAHLAERRSFAAFRRKWGPRRTAAMLDALVAPFQRASAEPVSTIV